MSPVAAWYLTRILSETPPPPSWLAGTNRAHAPLVAYKTGTSYGFRDAWAIGYTADYTVGVWVGRPDGSFSPGRMGREAAAPILFGVFDQLPIRQIAACAAARGRAGGDQCRAPRHAALFRCPADARPAARLQRGQGRAGDRLSRRWLDHRAGSPGPGAEEPAARCRWRRLAAALAGERQAHRLRPPSAARRNGSPTGPARCASP